MLLRKIQNASNGECKLPQELIDLIIDHLHDDHPSLSACSTVCRAWLSPAQYHLFYTIEIICSFLRNPGKYDRLLACLDTSPHLAAHVQTLKLNHTSWCFGSTKAETLLAALCSKLHGIKALTLQQAYIPALPAHLRESLWGLLARSTLTQLSLIEIGVQDFAELAALLTTCGSLIRLTLLEVRLEVTGAPSGSDTRRPRSMEVIAPAPFSLRALKLSGVSYLTTRSLLTFLGASVEYFELDDIFGNHKFEVDNAADYIPLSHMPSLRTLRLNLTQSALSNPGEWVVSLLASLASPRPSPKAVHPTPHPHPNCVERVVIQCEEYHLAPPRGVSDGVLDWEWYGAVDETLVGAAEFPCLRAVEVENMILIHEPGAKEERGEREFRECFPRLEGRGILRVRWNHEVLPARSPGTFAIP